jgi:hypothetical protein
VKPLEGCGYYSRTDWKRSQDLGRYLVAAGDAAGALVGEVAGAIGIVC